VLHYRTGLPQVTIATLFDVRPETVNRRIRDVRQLLNTAGHAITPIDQPIATLDDLYTFAEAAEINRPAEIKTAC
jgi:hypothetical protein